MVLSRPQGDAMHGAGFDEQNVRLYNACQWLCRHGVESLTGR